jgi:hypothetical protein
MRGAGATTSRKCSSKTRSTPGRATSSRACATRTRTSHQRMSTRRPCDQLATPLRLRRRRYHRTNEGMRTARHSMCVRARTCSCKINSTPCNITSRTHNRRFNNHIQPDVRSRIEIDMRTIIHRTKRSFDDPKNSIAIRVIVHLTRIGPIDRMVTRVDSHRRIVIATMRQWMIDGRLNTTVRRRRRHRVRIRSVSIPLARYPPVSLRRVSSPTMSGHTPSTCHRCDRSSRVKCDTPQMRRMTKTSIV